MSRLPAALAVVTLLCAAAAVSAEPPLREVVHQSPVQALAWSADGKLLATGSTDGVVRVTESATGKERLRFTNQGPVKALAFSPDGSRLCVKTTAGALALYETAKGQRTGMISLGNFHAYHLAFSPDGTRLVAAGVGEYLIWNHTKGGASGSRWGNIPDGYAAVSPDGRVSAWARLDGAMQIFDVEARQYRTLKVGPSTALAFGPEARLMAVAARDKSVRLWEFGRDRELLKLEGLTEPARLLAFSGNGKTLAAAGATDPVIRVWDVDTGRLRRHVTGNREAVTALALAPDGRSLAVAGAGNKALVWNVALREVVRPNPPLMLADKEMQSLWGALAQTDYAAADEAYQRLAAAGDRAVPFLKLRLRAVAVPPVDYQRIDKLVKDLDSPRFVVRDRASAELAKYGELAENALRKFLTQKPGLEPQRRAEKLLERLVDPPLTPERLRALEALALLESLATPAARQALEEVGRDALLPLLRLEALAALGRLKAAKATP